MCGIVGILDPDLRLAQTARAQVKTALNLLEHRGPDDSAQWEDPETGIHLGHRRLAILDLSPLGRQPMTSASGRYVIVYNGEVYNFLQMRTELESLGHKFSGRSDTEIMLASFEQWGVRAAVERFVGMFAFAVWDRNEARLHVYRDRLGIKPCYYGWIEGCFWFASELKAIAKMNRHALRVDREAAALFLQLGYIPSPHSIFREVRKLPAGHCLTVSADYSESDSTTAYWSPENFLSTAVEHNSSGREAEIDAKLHAMLRDSVKLRMISDVPIGAFLSGGIDSSTVVALMQSQTGQPVRTFTIGFHEEGYNEAEIAADIAHHLGTDHTQLYVDADMARNLIPKLPHFYDEPFGDPSQIPTLLLSQLTRRHVTVSLSGDGGDELFMGYSRYHEAKQLLRLSQRLPRAIRQLLYWTLGGLAFGNPDTSITAARLKKLLALLADDRELQIYQFLMSQWRDPFRLVRHSDDRVPAFPQVSDAISDPAQLYSMIDILGYLPDDILTKVDRATMAFGLEARVPLLDHRVVEYVLSLAPLTRAGTKGPKEPLLRLLDNYLPRHYFDRPKQGFAVPVGEWIRSELRPWASSVLNKTSVERNGILNWSIIDEVWNQHSTGGVNHQYRLWNVLMLEAWLQAMQEGTPA